jgi:hypothetical protein
LSSSSGTDDDKKIDERFIDRRLLDQLIARHGAPQQAPPMSFEEQERRTLIARRDRAIAAADPRLLHHLERHERDADRVAQLTAAELAPEPIELARFDLDAWRLRHLGEERELEPSEELREALEQRTPQAFLRDLHRPVHEFGDVQLRRVPSPVSGAALARTRAAIRELMAHRSGNDMVQPLSTRLMLEGMAELRTILARPWADSRPESPLPMPSRSPGAEDYMWFGLSGGYDPDV